SYIRRMSSALPAVPRGAGLSCRVELSALHQIFVRWHEQREQGAAEAVRPADDGHVSVEHAHSLLVQVMAGGVDVRRAELLLAWLRAWQHHWPQAAIAELWNQRLDVNRYLKFRRLAIENLARRL
ncbi:MAG: hypothetical protein WBV82_23045, partial [Myxococcaceae bacterium]